MENKILILLMSCNQPIYEQEEQACRDTFLKDAEGAGLSYYFYKGGAKELSVNRESHTMLLPVPDNLASTSRKTVLAFAEALKMDDWDYVVKTNVSTWLDVAKIMKAVEKWEGKDDRNIYGARFLANDASKNVPFPRGHFMVLSRFMVQGIVEWAPRLMNANGMPKTDDTLLCLSMLYHVQKICGDNYYGRLKEVPAVNCWTDEVQDSQEWSDAFSIRCKDEKNQDSTPDNMRKVHNLKHAKNQGRTYRRPIGPIETKYGMMGYVAYQKMCAGVEQLKKAAEENPVNETPRQQEAPRESKIGEIRKRLMGKK